MIINRICQSVTSLYKPAVFEIEASSEFEIISGNTIVEIIDAQTNQVVGIKRFNSLPARINVAPYARHLVTIKPTESNITKAQFIEATTHSAQLFIRIGTLISDIVTLLPAKREIANNQSVIPLYLATDTIKAGEQRNYLFFAKEAVTPSAMIAVSTIQGKEFSFSYQNIGQRPISGVIRFHLNSAAIETEAKRAGVDISDCASIKVKLLNNGELFSEITLKFMPAKSNTQTLCWLNKLGGFAYHAFLSNSHSNIEVSRSIIQSPSNYRSHISKVARKYELNTDYLSEAQLDNIADMLYSEHLWIASSDNHPAVIQNYKIVNHPNNLHSLSITITTTEQTQENESQVQHIN